MRQHIAKVALIVPDYDEAIAYYTTVLGFCLVADEDRGGGKRFVRVAPPGDGATELVLAKAVNDEQRSRIGNQTGGRVFLFLHTDDFMRDHAAYTARGVTFVEGPRFEAYGKVAVFVDRYGNRWDLIEPAP
ncbi:MAG: VOC family protein [Alphaproteobacteria bacterium]|nr:VOC family protein [Alphaproteobacteria bacterium]